MFAYNASNFRIACLRGFPPDSAQFARDLGAKVTELLGDPAKCERFGLAGRRRVEEVFSWTSVAAQTVELYRGL